MYIGTSFNIGEKVYFTDEGSCVIRATVREIRITQYEHGNSVRYLLAYGSDSEVIRDDEKLYRSPTEAFRAFDSEHPQVGLLAAQINGPRMPPRAWGATRPAHQHEKP